MINYLHTYLLNYLLTCLLTHVHLAMYPAIRGWSDRMAICLAVGKTGGIITAAGLIMVCLYMSTYLPTVIQDFNIIDVV